MDPHVSPSIPRRGSSKELPFYEVPDDKITSARIVSEAKSAIKQSPLRPVMSTRRPETPRDDTRKLFGDQSVRDPTNRPPSAFSLGSRHFDSESRPVSGTRLVPLDHKPKICEGEVKAPKPPPDPSRRRSGGSRSGGSSRTSLQHSVSVDTSLTAEKHVTSEKRKGSGETLRERRHATDTDRSARRHADVTDNMAAENGHVTPREGSAGSLGGGAGSSGDQPSSRGGSASSQGTGSAGKSRSAATTKPGSGGRREEESAEEAQLYNTRVAPLIDEMQTHIKGKDPDRLLALSERLYAVLDECDLLGKNCKRRPLILKTVFKLLDLVSPRLLLKLARLILALKVSGNNLTNVCKLVFKVSKDEKNDVHFTEDNILDLLVETTKCADHVTSADALVYCVGALKFLSGTASVIKQLARKQCLHAMAGLLANINKTNSETGRPPENLGHVLVQLTATLRNLAEMPSKRSEFVSERVLHELSAVMRSYGQDGDLMLNVVRIYSKLSVHNDVCGAMADEPVYFRAFVDLLKKYPRREDIIVRVCYILGNLTAKCDCARVRLWETERALDVLLRTIEHSLAAHLKQPQHKQPQRAPSGEDPRLSKAVDVVVKAVRVVANLAINPDIGPRLAASDACLSHLISILNSTEQLSNEELLLNTMSTVNNLSFYTQSDSAVIQRQLELADSLTCYIRRDNMEVLTEAVRVLGNLTRERPSRLFLYKHKLDEVMVDLLCANDKEVVFVACGVLINLMADEERRTVLKQQGGITKLLDVLRDFERDDWQLAGMVCKILWNYSGRITSSNAMFGETEAHLLADTLVDLLDREELKSTLAETYGDEDDALRQLTLDTWSSDFCPVARQLLERVDKHQSDLETLDHPS